MPEQIIKLIGGTGKEKALVTTEDRDELCHVTFEYDGRKISARAADFFEALAQVRLQLEKEHLMPYCYGASLNVFPAGISRWIGLGLKPYRLTKGKLASSDDMVHIFASGPDVVPVTVARQNEFFQEWLKSIAPKYAQRVGMTDPKEPPQQTARS